MKESIKFTIALPAYKIQYLEECITSITNQDYENWELIILNDQSPYNLDKIIEPYLKDSRIKYHENKKKCGARNLVNNWNKCLELSTGDYFICIGDDDMLTAESLTTYSKYIKMYPNIPVVHGRTAIIDDNNHIIDIQTKKPIHQSLFEEMLVLYKGDRQFIGDWCFRTKELKKNGGFYYEPYAWTSDHITVFQLAINHGIINTQEIVFLYRENDHSITNNTSISKEKVLIMNDFEKCIHNFLNRPAKDINDLAVKEILTKETGNYITKLKAYLMAQSIASNIWFIFHWTRNRKLYKITSSHIIRSLLLGIKIKLKK